jgi:tetratricopeptide (TPR) repeat protein
MIRFRIVSITLVALCALGTAREAFAWGERSQRVIAATAVSQLRTHHHSAFRSDNFDYRPDVIQGAADGLEALPTSDRIVDLSSAIALVGQEMMLLREVRGMGTGSYFAYRMGVLSSLVSSVLLPYGLEFETADRVFREQMFADIDTHVTSFRIEPFIERPRIVTTPSLYFQRQMSFYDDALILVANDYDRGEGYRGILRQAAPKYMQKSIESTIDVWYTVFAQREPDGFRPPSSEALTWYIVDEISYLLREKRNLEQARRVYGHFAAANPGLARAHERVGDAFYEFGERDDGVREWEYALNFSGPDRRRVVEKLAAHYTRVGREAMTIGRADARRRDASFEQALRAFERAYAYDSRNDEAAQEIQGTNVAIREREEARQLTMNFMATAESVRQRARDAQVQEDFGSAISTFESAVNTYEMVDDNFPEQREAAQDAVREIRRDIRNIIISLLDRGNQAIAAGDSALDDRRFEEAIAHYERVANVVRDVPDDDSSNARDKQELIARAEDKIATARVEQQRWQELEAARADQQGG